MGAIIGMPLVGSFFLPALVGLVVFVLILAFGTKPKDACNLEQLEIKDKVAVNGHAPSPEEVPVNVASAKRKRKVFSNKNGTFSRTARFDYKASTLPERINNISISLSPGTGSQVEEPQVEPSKHILKKKKKPCKGKAGCCSKKKSASRVLDGTIDTVKIFFGTQTGKSKVNNITRK